MTERRRLVFDCESVGLHGEAFAVGYVLLLGEQIIDESWAYCPPSRARGTREGRDWVREHCPWAEQGLSEPIRQEHKLPPGRRFLSPGELGSWFWDRWLEQRDQGAELWADVPWPVEARFLIDVIEAAREGRSNPAEYGMVVSSPPSARETQGPYPLFDVRTYVEALVSGRPEVEGSAAEGVDATVLVHHPIADARVSVQRLLRVERILRQCIP